MYEQSNGHFPCQWEMFANIYTKAIYVGTKQIPGRKNSVDDIEDFRLVSKTTKTSHARSNRNDFTVGEIGTNAVIVEERQFEGLRWVSLQAGFVLFCLFVWIIV